MATGLIAARGSRGPAARRRTDALIAYVLAVTALVGLVQQESWPFTQWSLVSGTPGRAPDLVRERALEALYGWINPVDGGPGGSGWPFDTDLTAGVIAEALAAVDGVDRVEEVVLFEADLRNRVRVGGGKELVRLSQDSLFLSFQHRVVVR